MVSCRSRPLQTNLPSVLICAFADEPAGAGVVDDSTKSTVAKIPLLSVRAGPRDGAEWINRLKQELNALIKVFCFICRVLVC